MGACCTYHVARGACGVLVGETVTPAFVMAGDFLLAVPRWGFVPLCNWLHCGHLHTGLWSQSHGRSTAEFLALGVHGPFVALVPCTVLLPARNCELKP